tara:strand:- start:103 stop:480 length:378 start_codon:yes stop_codon:yes gene_type:complete
MCKGLFQIPFECIIAADWAVISSWFYAWANFLCWDNFPCCSEPPQLFGNPKEGPYSEVEANDRKPYIATVQFHSEELHTFVVFNMATECKNRKRCVQKEKKWLEVPIAEEENNSESRRQAGSSST